MANRTNVAGEFSRRGGFDKLTVSIGVAALGEGTGVDILRRADVALYAAKHGGRNRLMCWTPELEKETFFGSFDDSQRVVSVAK